MEGWKRGLDVKGVAIVARNVGNEEGDRNGPGK
jgi:hypothetical protein